MTKRALFVVGSGAIILAVATMTLRPLPRLVWNLSASAPEGLYAVSPAAAVVTGDMVIAWVPLRYRRLAATRHYIPPNVPLVKQIVATSGDQICALGKELFLNGAWLAERQSADRMGRALPGWQGCVRLGAGQYFLLMAAAPLSFDGRYFGVTRRADIIGKARLLWAR